jgi:hypothetical protein
VRRFPSLLLGLFALLPACAGGEAQPANLPPARTLSAAGFDFTEVQRAVGRFLEAYADSSRDIEPLQRAVGGSDLREWVRWLEVQNQEVVLEGEVDVGRVRVLEVSDGFAAVGVDAAVRFTLPDGQVLVRRFESPFFLADEGPGGGWVVFDAVRDGRSMQESIGLLRPPTRVRKDGVTLEVSSVFRFSAGTLVNLVVENSGQRPVEVDPEASTLETTALPAPGSATNSGLARPIQPGDRVEGMIEFPPLLLDQQPVNFSLAFTGDSSEPFQVPLPPEAFAEQS